MLTTSFFLVFTLGLVSSFELEHLNRPKRQDDHPSFNDLRCSDPPTETGLCKALIQAVHFKDGECQWFQWGGCQPTENLFDDISQCQQACMPKKSGNKNVKRSIGELSPSDQHYPEMCLEHEVDFGLCFQQHVTAFHFRDGKCRPFQWGGCGSPMGVFYTEDMCHKTCMQFGMSSSGEPMSEIIRSCSGDSDCLDSEICHQETSICGPRDCNQDQTCPALGDVHTMPGLARAECTNGRCNYNSWSMMAK